MSINSSIEWTQATWNPVTGCTKISPGCKHCYAERMARRLKSMGQRNYANGFRVTAHPRMLNLPLRLNKSRIIFVNSMSDLFHESVPTDFIHKVFAVMNQASWHTFQVLTKRSDRLRKMDRVLLWSPNIWMGVSVENDAFVSRIAHLKETKAAVKFISFEPLLGSVGKLNLKGIDWVIVGGESGPNARHVDESWVIDICSQCQRAGVPFFFKQWGGRRKKLSGRVLSGRTWDEYPALEMAR